jgi:DNA-binding NtrC family response regulator
MEARVGLVQKAGGGTLFIDEISELSLSVQGKLLTLCEEGEYRSVGDSGIRKADIRLIVATNRMLKEEVVAGRFRPDLYYRLNVVTIVLEPLRQHPEDIPLLVRESIYALNEKYGRVKTVACETVWRLQECEWAGNMRELKKVIERGYLMADGGNIALGDMGMSETSSAAPQIPTLEVIERQHIKRVLDLVGGNKSKAARVLGVRRTTLYSRMEILGLGQ